MPAPVLTASFNVTAGFPNQGIPGLYADGTHPTENMNHLNQMIQSLLSVSGPTNGKGGTLEFPSAGGATYAFAGTITISTDGTQIQPYSIILKGDGQAQINAPLLQQTLTVDFFLVNKNPGGSQDIGGVVFEDLMMSYTSGGSGTYAAVHVTGGSSCVRLHRVTLVNCPIGYWLDNSLACSMIDSQVYNGSIAGTALMLGNQTQSWSAIETFIAGCTFEAAGAAKGLGVAVQVYGCEHLRMINTL